MGNFVPELLVNLKEKAGVSPLKKEKKRKRRSSIKKRYRQKNSRIFSGILIAALFIVLAGFIGNKGIELLISNRIVTGHDSQSMNIDLDSLYSPYAILKDVSSDNVLGECNSRDKIYPASLTKIMTAIVAIENTEDLEERITLPYEIFPPLYAQNAPWPDFSREKKYLLKICFMGSCSPPERSAALVLPDGWQVQRNSLYF